MESPQVVGKIFCGHTTPTTQEALDLIMNTIDGLDVEVATHPFASRLVQDFVGDLHGGGTAGQGVAAIGDAPSV
jgi:hypothetical protein